MLTPVLNYYTKASKDNRKGEAGFANHMIRQRASLASELVDQTLRNQHCVVNDSVEVFRKWMISGEIVRLLGNGRMRLALSIPGNRLAHGGARVSVVDGLVPCPNTRMGGAILAASSSGMNKQVLHVLQEAKIKSPSIQVIGIALEGADEFRSFCDLFIGVYRCSENLKNLFVLNDIIEQAICILLDGMVAVAGIEEGYDDERWRHGHENIGGTGPYEVR